MPGLVAAIIALVIGAVVGVGGSVVLVKSQGGGSFPEQSTGSITVYGTN
jgi:hypothetical protein